MEIAKGIDIFDLALYLKESKTLVMSDFHIGYEEALNKQGMMIPRFQFKDIVERLERILARVKAETIVINGDLKHEFGTISDEEWRNVLKILDLLGRNCKQIVLVKGNHDTILGPIAEKKNLSAVIEHRIDDILICHGDKLPKAESLSGVKTIIIGHEHPAVSLREDVRVEKFKCFLKGTWKKNTLIVLPSFSSIIEGTDVLKERVLSPFLNQDLGKFEVFVVGDQVYNFGKLNKLMNLQN
jgi:uncharacterized protein